MIILPGEYAIPGNRYTTSIIIYDVDFSDSVEVEYSFSGSRLPFSDRSHVGYESMGGHFRSMHYIRTWRR